MTKYAVRVANIEFKEAVFFTVDSLLKVLTDAQENGFGTAEILIEARDGPEQRVNGVCLGKGSKPSLKIYTVGT